MRLFTALGLLSLTLSIAYGQEAFGKNGQYAQFRNLSGLPGGTFGVNSKGEADARGAMAMSTPIAYSLKGGSFAGALSNTSYDRNFRMFKGAKKNDFGWESNGTAAGMAGISSPIGNFTVGMTVVSGAAENSYSVMFTPIQPKSRFTFGAGAEGLFSAGGFIGPGFHQDADRVISAFGVVTADMGKGIFVSGGWGTSRFSKGFANASAGIGPRIRATVEHDGFGWNYGFGAEVATVKVGSKKLHINAFAGIIQSRYAFWSTGFSF